MLHGGGSSVTLVPALGGKITEITLAGRQWLWQNVQALTDRPRPGVTYAASADFGGLDECFPTVAACRLPSWVKGCGDVALPEHGELWSQAPDVAIETDETGHRATCIWTGTRLPYRVTRRVTVRPDGAIDFAYTAENSGDQRLPFIWSSHPLFPLTPRTRILLPEGARTRVWSQHGADFGGVGAEQKWPRLRAGGSMADLSRPADALKKDFACKLFVDLPRAETVVALEEGAARLEIRVHGREIPHVGVWINRGGWNKFAKRRTFLGWRRSARCLNVAIEACLGVPDSLSEALGAWEGAHWLQPGTTARWSMSWRGVGAV